MSDANSKRETLFRQTSLDRLSSPEQLDQLMQLVGPKDWIPLLALGGLITASLGWSVYGQIPVTVSGQGVLIYPRQVVSLQSAVSGPVLQLHVEVGDEVEAGDLLLTLDQSELRQQLQQQQQKLQELMGQNQQLTALQAQRVFLELQDTRAQRQLLQQRITELETLIPKLRDRDLTAQAEQRQSVQNQLQNARTLLPKFSSRLEERQRLFEQGAISTDQLLVAEQDYQDILIQIEELEAQLKGLDVQETEREQQYLEELNGLAQLKAELQALDTQEQSLRQEDLEANLSRINEIQEVTRSITQLQTQLQTQAQITAEQGGWIRELTVAPGQVVSLGLRLGSVEIEDTSRSLLSLNYFPVASGKQIEPGMTVQVTPTPTKREEYGGMVGTVTAVSLLPATEDATLALLGNPQLVRGLLGQEPKVEVQVELQLDPATPSGYRWSSSLGPPLQFSAGTTTTSRVTVEERAPITFLLPLLRQASGLY